MTTYAAILGDCKCECSDPGCKAHKGVSDCRAKALQILYRVDMTDETGTAFCDACADDAFSSGLFTERDEDEDEDTEIGIRCDQCSAAMINGVFCHETGCPNTHSRYDAESGEWVKQRKCFDCGCMVDKDDLCCNESFDSVEECECSEDFTDGLPQCQRCGLRRNIPI